MQCSLLTIQSMPVDTIKSRSMLYSSLICHFTLKCITICFFMETRASNSSCSNVMTLPTSDWLICLEGGTSITRAAILGMWKGLKLYSDRTESLFLSVIFFSVTWSHSPPKSDAAIKRFTLFFIPVQRKLYLSSYSEKDDTSENKATDRLKAYRHHLASSSAYCKFFVNLISINLSFIKCTVNAQCCILQWLPMQSFPEFYNPGPYHDSWSTKVSYSSRYILCLLRAVSLLLLFVCNWLTGYIPKFENIIYGLTSSFLSAKMLLLLYQH